MEHRIKILPIYFQPVINGDKNFEIRYNDRNYSLGDIVILQEYNEHSHSYTGRSLKCKITFITDFMQKKGYVVFAFKKI